MHEARQSLCIGALSQGLGCLLVITCRFPRADQNGHAGLTHTVEHAVAAALVPSAGWCFPILMSDDACLALQHAAKIPVQDSDCEGSMLTGTGNK